MQCRIIVTSCAKNSRRWPSIQKNVASHLDFIYYGNPNQEGLYSFDHESKVLCIRTEDTYENLPCKFILALSYWRQHFKGSHLYKLDDDCELTGPLPSSESLCDYGGTRIHGRHLKGCRLDNHFTRVPPGAYWHARKAPAHSGQGHAHVHGGNGTLLSLRSVDLILAQWNLCNLDALKRYSPYDDVIIAEVLWKSGILPSYVNANIKGDHPHKP